MASISKTIRYLYGIFILFYIPFVIYLLFFAFFRNEPATEPLRIIPLYSTYQYLTTTIPVQRALFFVLGNIYLLFPFGFIGLVFPQLNSLPKLLPAAFVGITLLEILQQVTKRGVFDIDDIILNTLGVVYGYYTCNIMFRKFLWKQEKDKN